MTSAWVVRGHEDSGGHNEHLGSDQRSGRHRISGDTWVRGTQEVKGGHRSENSRVRRTQKVKGTEIRVTQEVRGHWGQGDTGQGTQRSGDTGVRAHGDTGHPCLRAPAPRRLWLRHPAFITDVNADP